ncbi:MAG: thrombospondin type 3 repeat-containing protein [candidate division Zixibacteria bacterium]|nr:thrombospondin type 3 repeat-containing protein [candidate division Zixibacteria bacterium]
MDPVCAASQRTPESRAQGTSLPLSPSPVNGGLVFEKNVGQWHDSALYRADGNGATVWVTGDGLRFVLARYPSIIDPLAPENLEDTEAKAPASSGVPILRVNTRFAGANTNPAVIPEKLEIYHTNYLKGNDPSLWHTGVPTYRSVLLEDVYPGISARYYGAGGSLEYDLIVDPGIDPAVVRIQYEGIESMSAGTHGELVIHTAWGDLTEKAPVVYQQVGNLRESVPAEFIVYDNNTFGFELLAGYHTDLPLVIDPVLSFSTYLGGGDNEAAYGVALSPSGTVNIVGATASLDFPAGAAYQDTLGGPVWDAFVTAYSADLSQVLFSTYFGGDADDYAYDLQTDGDGKLVIVGRTESTDLPVASSLQSGLAGGSDVFLVRLSADGSTLEYGTYLGGTGDDVGWSLHRNTDATVYVTGFTQSNDFPTVSPFQAARGGNWDAFLARFNAAGDALLMSTYLGGLASDIAQAVAVTAGGQPVLAGYTSSANFPTVNPLQANLAAAGASDIFVSRFGTGGAGLLYSTYFGGANSDLAKDMVLGSTGTIYLLGHTASDDYPTTSPYQASLSGPSDLVVTRLNAAGSGVLGSTYLGGSSDEFAGRMAVDDSGRVYIAATSLSSNFPLLSAPQGWNAGDREVVVTRLSAGMNALSFSTYLGGSGRDEADGLAIDAAYTTYVTGMTGSTNFPVRQGLQTANGGNSDVFLSCYVDDCLDTDLDGICDTSDNCISIPNPLQTDSDLDDIGDSCDVCPLDPLNDADEDGHCANEDNCPSINNPGQEDPDGDGMGNPCDNCPDDYNPLQTDTDNDGIGDSCDVCPLDYFNDLDGDSLCANEDNCPGTYNPDQADLDSNGVGDACEGCCLGSTGNVDCDELDGVDVGDLTRLIDHLFISFAPLCCPPEANTDGGGGVDVGDLTAMISHLFIAFNPLPPCL